MHLLGRVRMHMRLKGGRVGAHKNTLPLRACILLLAMLFCLTLQSYGRHLSNQYR